MKNKKAIIAAVLVGGAILSLVYGITATVKKRTASPAAPAAIQQNESLVPAENIATTKRRAVRTKFVSLGRNPFLEKDTAAISKKLTLKGILWSDKNPKAIIGNAVVGKGDKVDGNTVVDIKPDRVILNNGAKNFEMRLE